MYDNIGGKIKGLAFGTFIVEAIGAIISGIAIIAAGDAILVGLLLLILGPIAAWVGTLVLYGFGELIVKVGNIENAFCKSNIYNHEYNANKETNPNNTNNIYEPITKDSQQNNKQYEKTLQSQALIHATTCNNCKSTITKIPCSKCGYLPTSKEIPYWCGKCGNAGPFGGNCPNCGASLKQYNNL